MNDETSVGDKPAVMAEEASVDAKSPHTGEEMPHEAMLPVAVEEMSLGTIPPVRDEGIPLEAGPPVTRVSKPEWGDPLLDNSGLRIRSSMLAVYWAGQLTLSCAGAGTAAETTAVGSDCVNEGRWTESSPSRNTRQPGERKERCVRHVARDKWRARGHKS